MRAAVGLQQPADNSTATETGDNSTASAGGAGGTANTATVTGDNMTASAGVGTDDTGNAATATNNGTITRSRTHLAGSHGRFFLRPQGKPAGGNPGWALGLTGGLRRQPRRRDARLLTMVARGPSVAESSRRRGKGLFPTCCR
jgi:hypothetical protein